MLAKLRFRPILFGVLVNMVNMETWGRPCGSDAFIEDLEKTLGRSLRPSKGGRPPKSAAKSGLPFEDGADCSNHTEVEEN